MPSNPKILDQMRERQKAMFRIAQDPARFGLTLKVISMDSGLGYDSLRNYASGDTIMPITALDALVGVIPNQLLSILLPDGFQIVRVSEEINHDEIAEWAEHYAATKLAAHRADSECQEQIGPSEKRDLDNAVVQFPGGRAAA